MKPRFYEWLYGNSRFDSLVDWMLDQYDDAFVFGGYVRAPEFKPFKPFKLF